MSVPETVAATFFLEESMKQSRGIELKHGIVQVYSAPAPGEARRNEDAALVIALDGPGVILAVADGAGGHRFGAEASQAALRALAQTLSDPAERERSSRERILDGFEAARREVRELGVGALTTLTVVQIEQRTVRSFHVGDSPMLLMGQRGRLKAQTIDHTPAGYGLEAGLIDEHEALHHEERHIVTNLVGIEDMRIDMGSELQLASRDTLVLASDGLTDNLKVGEIVELMRKGALAKQVDQLVRSCQQRMVDPEPGRASKPDDLTIIAYRSRKS
jgi:serine/threonine protein phosphatase PrpC